MSQSIENTRSLVRAREDPLPTGLRFFARLGRVWWRLAPVAVSAGLAFGLVEAVTDLLFQWLVPGKVAGNSPDILYVAPIFDAVLFLMMGTALSGVFALVRDRPEPRVTVGLFVFAGLFGWLSILGELHQIAVVILSLGVAAEAARRLRKPDGWIAAISRPALIAVGAPAFLLGMGGGLSDGLREQQVAASLPAPQAGQPNVILITLDALRADHVSAMGYSRQTTPNLDRLAHRGVILSRAFANSSWTLPSHASLFTGKLPDQHRADWGTPLDGTYPTLAEVLASRGYLSAAFAANTAYITPGTGLDRGFAHFQVFGNSAASDAMRTVYGRKIALTLLPRLGDYDIPGRKNAAGVNTEFLSWLDKNGHRPFFAFLNYFDVHDPYLTDSKYQQTFSADATRGDVINFQFQAQAFRRKPDVSPAEAQAEIDGYDGALAYLDAQLGVLDDDLSRRGLDQNTLLIVTSDHGEAFGNHDLFGHGNSLYLETLHVPLIVYWPGHIPAGVRLDRLTGLNELPGTIMELAAGQATPFAGGSLAEAMLKGTDSPTEQAVVAELTAGRFKEGPANYPVSKGNLRALITPEWHLIVSDSGAAGLYSWSTDPSESNDLAHSPEGGAVAADLASRLDALQKAGR